MFYESMTSFAAMHFTLFHFIISRPGQSSFLSSCRNGQRRPIDQAAQATRQVETYQHTKQQGTTTLHCIAPTVDSDFTWVSSCTPPTNKELSVSTNTGSQHQLPCPWVGVGVASIQVVRQGQGRHLALASLWCCDFDYMLNVVML